MERKPILHQKCTKCSFIGQSWRHHIQVRWSPRCQAETIRTWTIIIEVAMFVSLFLVYFISKKNKYKEKIPAHLFVLWSSIVWTHPSTYNFPNDHGFNGYSFLELIDMNKQSWDRLSVMFCFFLCGLWYKISSMLVGESDYYTMVSHQKLIN